jgi:3-dehydroquinate dehydratase-2
MAKKFIIINGPNLNKLGEREPDIYGTWTLERIQRYTEEKLASRDVQLDWFQSNGEGEIVSKIQDAAEQNDIAALIINPAGFSHTSVAIHDALKLLKIPIVEVHLTNVHAREDFRRTLLTAQAATIIMGGLREKAYYFAVLSQLQ